jgi:hypothetical protein
LINGSPLATPCWNTVGDWALIAGVTAADMDEIAKHLRDSFMCTDFASVKIHRHQRAMSIWCPLFSKDALFSTWSPGSKRKSKSEHARVIVVWVLCQRDLKTGHQRHQYPAPHLAAAQN